MSRIKDMKPIKLVDHPDLPWLAEEIATHGLHPKPVVLGYDRLRVHSCVGAKEAWALRNRDVWRAVLDGVGRLAHNTYQPDGTDTPVLSSLGWLLPVNRGYARLIPTIAADWDTVQWPPNTKQNESAKGRAAEAFVMHLLIHGLVPPLIGGDEVTFIRSAETQRLGIDVNWLQLIDDAVESKADYHGGSEMAGGTGNLYIELAEINPDRKH